MNSIDTNKLIIAVIAAAVLGILFGLFLPDLMMAMAFIGTLFVNVLQITFIPLVGSAIITGVSAFANSKITIRASLATLFMFLSTTVTAIVIGLILVSIFKPGVGINTGTAFIPEQIAGSPLSQSLDFLNELVPSNIVSSVMQGKFLGWMIALTIAATIIGTLGQRARALTDFFEVIYTVMMKVVEKLMYLLPVGIFFIIGDVFARNSGYFGSITGALGKLSLVLLIAFLIHAFLVVPLLLKYLSNRSPLSYFANVFPALKTALVTSSPTAAIPVTYENSIERNHIDKRVASLVLPVGSSLNVNGRALYVTVCALFIAQAFDLSLGLAGTLYIAMAAMFFSMGTAIVPFAAMLSLVAVFDSAGFPNAAYAGIGLIFVIDWFWGRVFAALDVWSDTAVAAIVEKTLAGERTRPGYSERDERPRYERGRHQRDYRERRPRSDHRGRDHRRDRTHRPYSKPVSEPVRPTPSAPEREPFKRIQKDTKPSPFELKAENEFDLEAAKSGAAQPDKPTPIEKKNAIPERRDRRKVREQKKYTHGHETSDSEVKEKRRSKKVPDEKTSETISPPPKSVSAPPPLIRDIVKPDIPKIEKPVEEPAPKIEPKKETEQQEVQTSLFGRGPQRKSPRSKSDSKSEPVKDTETYPKENQEFGRGTRKKKPK